MSIFTSPDLSITITEEEAVHAFQIYDHIDWDGVEAGIPADAKDTAGNPVDRHNQNLKVWMMASAAVTRRVGFDASTREASRLLGNPMFEQLIESMITAFEMTQKARS